VGRKEGDQENDLKFPIREDREADQKMSQKLPNLPKRRNPEDDLVNFIFDHLEKLSDLKLILIKKFKLKDCAKVVKA